MTIINGYCTLAEIKEQERLNISVTTFDTALEGVIEAVSRAIDNLCARFFWTDQNDVTRYFTAQFDDCILIGDWASITTVSTDNSGDRVYTDWTSSEYDLWPYDANSDGKPYMMIQTAPQSGKRFYIGITKGVKIVGKRGYPAVPKPIKEACLIWSMRAYKRYATPLGVSAMTALGQLDVKVPPPDPDVMTMLTPYVLQYIG